MPPHYLLQTATKSSAYKELVNKRSYWQPWTPPFKGRLPVRTQQTLSRLLSQRWPDIPFA